MTDLETSRPYFICRINRLSQAQALHKEFPQKLSSHMLPQEQGINSYKVYALPHAELPQDFKYRKKPWEFKNTLQ